MIPVQVPHRPPSRRGARTALAGEPRRRPESSCRQERQGGSEGEAAEPDRRRDTARNGEHELRTNRSRKAEPDAGHAREAGSRAWRGADGAAPATKKAVRRLRNGWAWLWLVAFAACSSTSGGKSDGGAAADAADANPDVADTSTTPDGSGTTDAGTDAEPCPCEHMPYIGSGDDCGPGPSCTSVGLLTCYRCLPACIAAPSCQQVGTDSSHTWWCCT